MTARLTRRAGALTLIAAAATALTGCDGAIGAKLTYEDTEKVKVTEIVVAGASGDVRVRTAAIGETHIKRVVRGGTSDPGASYQLSGTTLTVDTSCGDDCHASYEIEAPTGVAVRGTLRSGYLDLLGVATADVSVTSGEIHIEQATGEVKAKATSGNIVANRLAGPATLIATSGNIEALELTGGGAIRAEASSGNVDLLLREPASVTAGATSGNVDLAVPAGSYRIVEQVGAGRLDSQVRSDPKAKQVLTVRTSSGDATIRTT
ncbi:DUF4097 family beta strand repeat-containing protein [Couchioplanes azureus]|uniref:DUF4097 family beta strand repeat-containing protein n=1 Tax=Couchioplanes caeruleus TaxID=56438 RepID=UPI0019BEE017|nr:DUF4097 family beta strand repeat-containing protein [Couchioplanes caeruleus]GGQ80059.1 hypothetical protein GCM10010166_57780 [Couchioplanes caeruleus subsp. azureus]